MPFDTGSEVRLAADAGGVAAGTSGVVVGWYTNTREALVRFAGGDALRVRVELLEAPARPEQGSRQPSASASSVASTRR